MGKCARRLSHSVYRRFSPPAPVREMAKGRRSGKHAPSLGAGSLCRPTQVARTRLSTAISGSTISAT